MLTCDVVQLPVRADTTPCSIDGHRLLGLKPNHKYNGGLYSSSDVVTHPAPEGGALRKRISNRDVGRHFDKGEGVVKCDVLAASVLGLMVAFVPQCSPTTACTGWTASVPTSTHPSYGFPCFQESPAMPSPLLDTHAAPLTPSY